MESKDNGAPALSAENIDAASVGPTTATSGKAMRIADHDVLFSVDRQTPDLTGSFNV